MKERYIGIWGLALLVLLSTGGRAEEADPAQLIADIDGDLVVGFGDFFILTDQFNATCDEDCAGLTSDLNGDRVVNFDDFFILVDNFGVELTPLLQPLEDQTVVLGTSLRLQLTPQDAAGPLTYGVLPLPLPANAAFDARSGLFTFAPSASQAGQAYTLTFIASDGEAADCRTLRLTVTSPEGLTILSGRVLDTEDFAERGVETPVVGATVSALGTGIAATTDAEGFFALPGLPTAGLVLDIDAATAQPAADGSAYASFREALTLVEGVDNRVERPFYLPRIATASLTAVDSTATTLVENAALEVVLEVPAASARNADGSAFSGQLSVSEVPRALAPAALPAALQPGLLITIQPVGITFDPPAPLRFPNTDELAPQSEVDLWSLDPLSGTFEVVGRGQVSEDGSTVQIVEGGVRASDWHFVLPPQVAAGAFLGNEFNQDQSKCLQCPTGSQTHMLLGSLTVGHTLAGYRSLEQDRALRLSYHSLRADPQPIVGAAVTVPVRSAVPQAVSARLEVAGVYQGDEVFTDTRSLSESRDEAFGQALQFDAADLSTGRYPYRMHLTSHFARSAVSTVANGQVLVDNRRDSPFGAGWSLEGLQRIYRQDDQSVVLTEGDGTVKVFTPQAADLGDWGAAGPTFSGDWAVDSSGTAVQQTANGLPTFFIGAEDLIDVTIGGTIRVDTFNDDDFVGFVFGYQGPLGDEDAMDFLLFDWKQVAQEGAEEGFTLARVSGSMDEILGDILPFWDHSYAGIEILDREYGPNQGWIPFVEHRFELVYTRDRIRISIDGREIFNVGGRFEAGRFGFYNYSQDAVRYQATVAGEQVLAAPEGDFSELRRAADGSYSRQLKDGTRLLFDEQGLHTQTLDRNGNATTYRYDGEGRLTEIVDPVGLATRLSYSGGRLAVVVDPAGRQTRFEHDADGNLRAVTDADGTRRSFGYDSRHRLVEQTSKRGFATRYAYDFAGRHVRSDLPDGSTRGIAALQSQFLADPSAGGTRDAPAPVRRFEDLEARLTDGGGNSVRFTMDRFGAGTGRTDALGNTTRIERDIHGQALQVTRPGGAQSELRYDPRGNLLAIEEQATDATTAMTYEADFGQPLTVVLPDGATFAFTYDSNGNPTEMTDPLGQTVSVAYDGRGLPLRTTDALGRVTAFAYDAQGNAVEVTDAAGGVTALELDSSGNPTLAVEAQGSGQERRTVFTYDLMNRLTGVTDATGATTALRYDADGNLVEIETPTGEALVFSYDALGRMTGVAAAGFGQQRWTYDGSGNLIEHTDAMGQTTRLQYDALNRLVQATDALGGVRRISYDANGNPVRFVNALGQATEFEYDGLDRLVAEVNALGEALRFEYDALDRLVALNDAAGQRLEYAYDRLSRLSRVESLDKTLQYSYDAVGNLTAVAADDSRVTFAYDALDRTIAATTEATAGQPGVTLSYAYDALGNRIRLGDSAGGAIEYGYDAAGRLVELTAAGQRIGQRYDVAGRLVETSFPNGMAATRRYDAQGRLDSLAHSADDGRTLGRFTYAYNASGNIVALSDLAGTRLFAYDARQRLTEVTAPGASETYRYDVAGNRAGHRYDAANRLLEDDAFTYTYDANGNLTSTRSKATDELIRFTYDALFNRLVRVDFADGTVATYRYDGLGRRIAKSAEGRTVRYVYDHEDILLSYDGDDVLQARYVHGEGMDWPLALQRDGASFFFLVDHQGSVHKITDAAGAVVNEYDYDAYGRLLAAVEGVPNPYAYTGREYDAETGLYFYRARYYSAPSGRFTSEDPLGFGGGDPNFYRYVLNNPLNLVDPTGQFGLAGVVFGAVAGAAGAIATGGLSVDNIKAIALGAAAGAAIGLVNPALSASVGASAGGAAVVGAASGLAANVTGQVIGDKLAGRGALERFSPVHAAGAALGGGLVGHTVHASTVMANIYARTSVHAAVRQMAAEQVVGITGAASSAAVLPVVLKPLMKFEMMRRWLWPQSQFSIRVSCSPA